MQNWKKHIAFASAMFALLFVPDIAESVTVTVNPQVKHQVFEGWGTSICWWGNIIGKYPEKERDSIMDLLFDTANGLGLSIVRYNIGGGDNPSHGHMGTGKMMDGFKASETASYDWTKDAGQRWIVNAAKERIPSEWFIAEAFSNSPPYWMTESGCASGGVGGSNNLKSNYYDQFADYLVTVVKHFEDEWGIKFRTLEPMNEPDIGWTVNGGQEGCSFSYANQAKLITAVKKKIDDKKLTTEISSPDGSSYGASIAAYNSYDATIKSYINQINTHGYYGGSRTDLQGLAQRDGKRMWASEIDGSGASAPFDQWKHNHGDVVPGLDIAERIIRDLRDLKAVGWVFWQIVESEQAQTSLNKNWGCIHADFNNGGKNFSITKKFHALRQFSGFIRPFSKMISIDNNDAVAFLSSDMNQLVIVQRNASNAAVSYDYQLSNFQAVSPVASVWRTSSLENFKKLDNLPVVNDILSVTLPSQSIATFVVPLQYVAGGNMIFNGDFSSGTDNWTFNVWDGSGTGSVKNGEYCINVSSVSSRSLDIQLVQSGVYLEKGKTYKVAFDAYGSAERMLEVNIQMSSDPWTSYLPELQHFDLTAKKQTFDFTFTVSGTGAGNAQIAFNAGTFGETAFIDNVSVKEFDPTDANFERKVKLQPFGRVTCANSTLKIEFTAQQNIEKIKMYDLGGNLIKTIRAKANSGEKLANCYNLSNLTNGYYIVKIDFIGNKSSYLSKVLVTR